MSNKDTAMGFAKLTRASDFGIWQFRMELHLMAIGVFAIVDGTEVPPGDPNASSTEATEGTHTEEEEQKRPPVADRHMLNDWREYTIRRDMATAHIMQGLTDELAKHYQSEDLLNNPAKLWNKLAEDSKTMVEDSKARAVRNVFHLRRQLPKIKLENCGSVDAYVDKFQQLCDKIALAGQTISDGERYFYMMKGLPDDWENYKEVLEFRVPNSDNWWELIPLMTAKEAELKRRKGLPPEASLFSKGYRNGGRQRGASAGRQGNGKKRFEGECNGCGQVGHKKVDCWHEECNKDKRPKGWKPKNGNASQETTLEETTSQVLPIGNFSQMFTAMVVGDHPQASLGTRNPGELSWILSSGCTRHMTSCRDTFTTYTPIPAGQHIVETITEKHVSAIGYGTVLVTVDAPGGRVDITLQDVLHVPNSIANYVSVTRLVERGMSVRFGAGKAVVMRGMQVWAIAPVINKQYQLGIGRYGVRRQENPE